MKGYFMTVATNNALDIAGAIEAVEASGGAVGVISMDGYSATVEVAGINETLRRALENQGINFTTCEVA